MNNAVIILTLISIVSVSLAVYFYKKYHEQRRYSVSMTGNWMDLMNETGMLKKQLEQLSIEKNNVFFQVGEMLCQIGYQLRVKEIPTDELSENADIVESIGNTLKDNSLKLNAKIKGEPFKDQSLSDKLCFLTGRQEKIVINNINLIRLADYLFCKNYIDLIKNDVFPQIN